MLNGRVGEKKEKIMYEYVTRKEYQPVQLELEEIIRKVHHYMRDKHDLTFQHKLIRQRIKVDFVKVIPYA